MWLWIYLLFRYKTLQCIQIYGLTKLHSVTHIRFNMTFLSTANFTQFYTCQIQTLLFQIQFQHYGLNNFNHRYKNYNFGYNDFYYGYKLLYWLQFTINLTIFHFHVRCNNEKPTIVIMLPLCPFQTSLSWIQHQ